MISDLQASVFRITSSDPATRKFGTGFVIYQDKQATYLLTCAHVVDGLSQVKVGSNAATVIAYGSPNGPNDLAVLKVEDLLNTQPVKLTVSGEKGLRFIAEGFRKLYGEQLKIAPIRGSLGDSVGLESINQVVRIDAWDLDIDEGYQLQSGYSGSPVADETYNNVLGIVRHQEGERKGVAISIGALPEVWTEMPISLLKGEDINISPPYSALSSVSRKRKKTLETIR